MYNQFDETTTRTNTGYDKLLNIKEGFDDILWLVPPGTTIATKTLAETQSTWTALIQNPVATRMIPMIPAGNIEDKSKEDTVFAVPTGGEIVLEAGKEAVQLTYYVGLAYHKKLKALDGVPYAAFRVDTEGNIKGWSEDGTILKPFSITLVNVKSRKMAVPGKPHETVMSVSYSNPRELNNYGVLIQGSTLTWEPRALEGLYDVNLVLNTVTATTGNFTPTLDTFVTTNSRGWISGLVAADFVFKKGTTYAAATPVSIATMSTIKSDGSYDITFTTQTSGLFWIEMVAPSANSLKAIIGLESTAPASLDATIA